jgi:ferredoxin
MVFRQEFEMKVWIDEGLCVGNGTCVEICPDVFEMRGDVAGVKMEEIPEKFQDSCEEAVASCPTEAIIVEED